MSCMKLQNVVDQFTSFTQKPVNFLSVQTDAKEGIKNLVKTLYDFTKSQENVKGKGKTSALRQLIVEDFDEEQVWQQIELQNTECWDNLVWEVANCITNKGDLEFPLKLVENVEQDAEDGPEASESEDIEDEEEEDEQEEKKVKSKVKSKSKPSIVDDKFFKLQEMEQFLLKEEKEGKPSRDSDDESIDLFEDIDSDGSEEEGGKKMKYADFFMGDDNDDDDDGNNVIEEEENIHESPKKKKKKVSFAVEEPESDDEKENEDMESDDDGKDDLLQTKTLSNGVTVQMKQENKSEFELRQQRLNQQISRLEERTLSEAPWQLKGEVDATKRPQNSLLEEVVDFDQTSRPPPIITEQTTQTLEDIIRQRIKDKAWDDVERKEKPVEDILSFRKTQILDQSKSKMSLAQVYEAEYLKQKQASSGEVEEEKEPEAHTEIRTAMKSLFAKLDALCHYHYTPKAVQPEVKIVSNTPAISMEEVAPVATSDATLLAPEEVKRKQRGDLMSKEERTDTDKKRERRKKKKIQREKGSVAKVTDQRNTKKGVEATDKSLKTSKAFFQQLNDDASSKIKKKVKSK